MPENETLTVVIGASGGIGAALAAELSRSSPLRRVVGLSRRPAPPMKHLLPLLLRDGRSVFATLSAKVGSIGDNRLGGWYAYRASKAALNQLVRTASIELRRRCPEAVCVALHPGTVDTPLSAPFGKAGLEVRPAAEAARLLVGVLETLQPAQSGGFFDYRGQALPW
ncbi:Rossmann-fold NAD(P)-binding domain-containing protein [Zeimonas arvi]|uniref:SDR family NAD(P)-dependent oxidoreductase n=1 Tax=Zeimonas arvi TaxID=2498847 RepID=A0A5C8P0Y8_9BURK|nr:SDR family NAD(P)-dependent oxidoreductase [Zeimonas arvi]TXL67279.1 SDR family NAD(P)-dependent oxidoreductase [Zeimonas arvi]